MFTALLTLSTLCYCQIDISDIYKPYQPIEARCACVLPEGAKLRVSWQTPKSVAARAHPAGKTALYLWAPPGSHTIQMTQIMDFPETLVILVPNPTPEDPEGLDEPLKKTITIFTKPSTFAQYSHTFRVSGKVDPEPDPDPDPDNGEVTSVVIIEETDQRTPMIAAILQEVRQRGLNVRKLYIGDKDQPSFQSVYRAVVGQPLPQIVALNKDGKVIRKGPLPMTYDAVLAFVQG
jgi:hypothetical protein